MNTILVKAIKQRTKLIDTWYGYWRTDSRHVWQKVLNRNGHRICYTTKDAALAGAAHMVREASKPIAETGD